MTAWCPLLPPPRASCCLWNDELACDRREPSLLWVSPPMFGVELGLARRLLPTMLIFSSPTGTDGADETPRRGPLLLGRCMRRTARVVSSALVARPRGAGAAAKAVPRYHMNATVGGAEPWPQVHPGILRARGAPAAGRCERRAAAAASRQAALPRLNSPAYGFLARCLRRSPSTATPPAPREYFLLHVSVVMAPGHRDKVLRQVKFVVRCTLCG